MGKFVSGLLSNTPLSKWFGRDAPRNVRKRDDADCAFQPPTKRAKLPETGYRFESPVTVHNASNSSFRRFPEPVAGPSGVKARKLFDTDTNNTLSNSFDSQDIVNGEVESDSEESTSGYSSAPRNRDKKAGNQEASEKNVQKSLFTATSTSTPGRTLFGDRSAQSSTSLSSRRPAFNASTFGSPNFVDRTLSTKRVLSSPFYSGHTIYGGASAYGRRLGRRAEESKAAGGTRLSVQIKPVNEKPAAENTTLSKTARRILSTLEQYSTPISDAKKIPVVPRKQGMLSKYIGATPYLARERRKPSSQELQVPTVPELLQMKQKQRLQDSTESVRQMATTSKSTLNKEEYKLRTDDDGGSKKQTHKMKSNVTSVRQKPVEMVSEVKLPKVTLPITELPKFDFVMMSSTREEGTKPQVSTAVTEKSKVSNEKEERTSSVDNGKTNDFKFSEPLVISKDVKPVPAINCFKFSEPVPKKQDREIDNSKTGDKSIRMKNNGENVFKVSATKDEDSSRDKTKRPENEPANVIAQTKPSTGFGDKFKLTSDKWECGTCMVRNDISDKNCVACGCAKSDGTKKSTSPFGDKFKSSVDTWECSSCLVRNKNESDKCAACATPRSGTKPSNFGEKFKPAADTWECSTCMIRNKNELTKCQACETPKDSTKQQKPTTAFGDKFKMPSDSWECPTCMIRNKNEAAKCAACETAKPGQKPTVTFNFGIAPLEWECKTCMIKNKNDLIKCAACGTWKGAEKTSFGDDFKAKQGEWECSSCLVRNKGDIDNCVCCGVSKPGVGTSEKFAEISKGEEKKPVISFNFGIDKSSGMQFKFGIPTTSAAVTTVTTKSEVKNTATVTTTAAPIAAVSTAVPTFNFGTVAKTSTVTSGSFSFGVSTEEIAQVSTVTSSSETVKSMPTNPLLKPTEKLPEKAVPAPAGFKFGLDSSSSQKNDQIQISKESLVTSTSKTEALVGFSTTFEPPKTTPTFQFKPTAINGDVNKPKEALFGTKPPETNALFPNTTLSTPSSFKFNVKPPEPTATTAPIFKFGGDTQPAMATKKTFGESSKSSVSNGFGSMPKIPAFGGPQTFGTAENKPAFGTVENKPPTFVESKPPTFGTLENKPVFGTAESKPVPPFGGVESKPVLPFGGVETKSTLPFGGVESKPALPFGGVESKSAPAFGGMENKPFTFGASEAAAPKNTTFTFGQTDKPAENPVFNFGSAVGTSTSSAPGGGFNFASPPSNTGFSFGSGAKVESQPFSAPPANVFGAPPPAAAAAAKNGSFNFGSNSNNNNQKAIFSFGASPANTPGFGAQQSRPTFSFGAPTPPQSIPSGGFTFTGAPPSFNFTDGSGSTAPPQRKIKKAVRRTTTHR